MTLTWGRHSAGRVSENGDGDVPAGRQGWDVEITYHCYDVTDRHRPFSLRFERNISGIRGSIP